MMTIFQNFVKLQVAYMVEKGVIGPFCNLLNVRDMQIVQVCLSVSMFYEFCPIPRLFSTV